MRIEYTLVFEARKRIRGQYFRPFVTVVAGSITTAEYVREAVLEAIVFGRYHHGDLTSYFVE